MLDCRRDGCFLDIEIHAEHRCYLTEYNGLIAV